MLSQTKQKKDVVQRNIKRTAQIKYLLSINGYTQTKLAKELGISIVWLNYYIQGKVNSPRVENWLKENLGI